MVNILITGILYLFKCIKYWLKYIHFAFDLTVLSFQTARFANWIASSTASTVSSNSINPSFLVIQSNARSLSDFIRIIIMMLKWWLYTANSTNKAHKALTLACWLKINRQKMVSVWALSEWNHFFSQIIPIKQCCITQSAVSWRYHGLYKVLMRSCWLRKIWARDLLGLFPKRNILSLNLKTSMISCKFGMNLCKWFGTIMPQPMPGFSWLVVLADFPILSGEVRKSVQFRFPTCEPRESVVNWIACKHGIQGGLTGRLTNIIRFQ